MDSYSGGKDVHSRIHDPEYRPKTYSSQTDAALDEIETEYDRRSPDYRPRLEDYFPTWRERMASVMTDILVRYNQGQSNIWVRTEVPSSDGDNLNMITFIGQPRKLYLDAQKSSTYCYVGSRVLPNGRQDDFKCILPTAEFDDISEVVPVFEIVCDNEMSHPRPLIRVPEPGPYHNWTDVHCLGLRFDYIKNGKVLGHYHHINDHVFPYFRRGNSEHDAFLTGPWTQAMAWMATLLNLEWEVTDNFNHPALTRYCAEIEILEVLNNSPPGQLATMVVSKSVPRESCATPKRTSLEASMGFLTEMYRKVRNGTKVGHWSPRRVLPCDRKTCDACYLSTTKPSVMTCPKSCIRCEPRPIRSPDVNRLMYICDFCESLGRVCTFTPDQQLDEHVDDLKFLGYARPTNAPRELSEDEEHVARCLLDNTVKLETIDYDPMDTGFGRTGYAVW